MSALDRAFIKAYAKDIPAAEPVAASGAATTTAPRELRTAPPPVPPAQVIEQIYHDGSLYRVEAPPASPRRVAVPAPHFQLPPRTSPRRNVRRSLLKLLGADNQLATPMQVDPPAARTVPAPKLANLLPIAKPRPTKSNTRRPIPKAQPIAAPPAGSAKFAKADLTPESIGDAPSPVAPLPVQPLPVAPAPVVAPKIEPAPAAAPAPLNIAPPAAVTINLAEQLGPQIAVHGHWESNNLADAAPLVVLKEPANLELTATAQLLELKLDALPLPPEPQVSATPTFRVDPPHAIARPHAKFLPQAEPASAVIEEIEQLVAEELAADEIAAEVAATHAESSGKMPSAYFGDVAIEDGEPEAATEGAAADEELNFADLDPVQAAATIAAATSETTDEANDDAETVSADGTRSEPATADDCIPVWEVDRFQWPITVERLTSDKSGYFAQAGERLVAAVRDGLRTLAITGSRRGEGRSTLTLCLARAAAKAGIQVAVIDADFARPQLAGKIGLDIAHGWQDAATGLIPLSEAAVRSLTDNITVLPLEAATARGQLALSDPRVTATLRAAAATFELVLVDLGPLPAGDDDLFPAGEACPFDAAIVVRDLRYASSAESSDVGERLYAAGIEAVGVAENFVVEEEIPVTSV
jgi:Mrp family chromosome partitioning ATPase